MECLCNVYPKPILNELLELLTKSNMNTTTTMIVDIKVKLIINQFQVLLPT